MPDDSTSEKAGGGEFPARIDHSLDRQIRLSAADPNAPMHLPHVDGRPKVLVHFTGDRADLEAAGMIVTSVIGDVAIGHVAVGDVQGLAEVSHVVSVDGASRNHPHLHDSVPRIHAAHSQLDQVGLGGLTGRGVVVGIVDTGVDIFHYAFRRPNGSSRIIEIWDQKWNANVDPDPPLDDNGEPVQPVPHAPTTDPAGTPAATRYGGNFNFGKIYSATDIARALHRWETEDPKPTNLPKVLMPQDRDPDHHGTHVAGIAAGNGAQSGGTSDAFSCHAAGYYMGAAPEADLVVVRVKFDSHDVVGADYIFHKAGSDPAVVNFSIGNDAFNAVADGTSNEERAWDNLLVVTPGNPATARPGRAVVMSAGNRGRADNFSDGNGVSRGVNQVKVTVRGSGTATVAFVVPSRSFHSAILGLFYTPPSLPAAEVIRLTVTPPNGPAYQQVPLAASTTLTGGPTNADSVTADSGFRTVGSAMPPLLRGFIDLTISPRTPPSPSPPAPPPGSPASVPPRVPITPGTWRLLLNNTSSTDVDVILGITNELPYPAPHFVEHFDGEPSGNPQLLIWTKSTVTSPSTADNVICVGNLDTTGSTLAIARSSSRGPRADQSRNLLYGVMKPDFSAPGEAIVSARSGFENEWACSECCLTAYRPLSGTSMAAPHVTGIVALMLQRNPTLSFSEIRRLLREHCDDPPAEAMDPARHPEWGNVWGWEDIWGAGVVNAVRTLSHVNVPTGAPDPLIPGNVNSVASAALPPDPNVSPVYAMTADPGWPERLSRLDRLFGGFTLWPDLQAIVSTHFDEVHRLINTNRRVATMWHRIGGPPLVRRIFAAAEPDRIVLPAEHDGRQIAAALKRWLALLSEFGSPGLREAITEYGPTLLALPGATFVAPSAANAVPIGPA